MDARMVWHFFWTKAHVPPALATAHVRQQRHITEAYEALLCLNGCCDNLTFLWSHCTSAFGLSNCTCTLTRAYCRLFNRFHTLIDTQTAGHLLTHCTMPGWMLAWSDPAIELLCMRLQPYQTYMYHNKKILLRFSNPFHFLLMLWWPETSTESLYMCF